MIACRHDVEIECSAAGVGEVRDAERTADAFAYVLTRRAGSDHDLDPAHQRPHALHVEIGDRFSEVPHEARKEPRAVLPFERELLVVDDDGVHRTIGVNGSTP